MTNIAENINVCINGTFRYPQYIRYYDEAKRLNKFYFSHRVSTNARSMHVRSGHCVNIWPKEYMLHLALRAGKARGIVPLSLFLGDLWQSAVIANWSDSDAVEAVIGGIADRVFRHAKRRGARTLGHPVNSHPNTFSNLIARECESLGVPVPNLGPPERRMAEIEQCDHILADSRFVAKSFVDAGFPTSRISIVTPAVDFTHFFPRREDGRRQDVFRVVSVGAITPRKGHRYLLKAWKQLNLPASELILVGASSAATKLIFAGQEATFTHIERLPHREMRSLLTSAAAFVLPSIEDGFSQAAVEALSCGVPTVVTSNMGVADLIVDGINGYIVPPFDSDAIAAILYKLHSDRDLAATIGASAAASTFAALDWKGYVQQVISVHDRMNS